MPKILSDILINPVTGVYSRKSVYAFWSFLGYLGFKIAQVFNNINVEADALLWFCAAALGLTVLDKFNPNAKTYSTTDTPADDGVLSAKDGAAAAQKGGSPPPESIPS